MKSNDNVFYVIVSMTIILIACIAVLAVALLKSVISDMFGVRNGSKPVNVQDVLSGNKSSNSDVYKQNVGVNHDVANTSFETEIKINPLKDFSGMRVDEVLNQRKLAVQSSALFSHLKNYEPSKEVFQIEDGLKWISAYEISCYGVKDTKDIGKGPSRESLGILNPELMFYLNISNYEFYKENYCSEIDYLIPYKLTYNKSTNTINAYINYTDFYKKNKIFYGIILEDANAHDFGYRYVKSDFSQNVRYRSDENLSTHSIETRGFYHRGGSCEVPEGCNNYSPYESGYHFYLTKLPAKIHIKLWKKEPVLKINKPDLNYQLIFE